MVLLRRTCPCADRVIPAPAHAASGILLLLLATVVLPCSATFEDAWHKTMRRTAAFHVDNQRVGDVLGPMLNYKFRSPLSAVRKGLVYTGHNARLRRAVKVLLSGGHADGRPFKIGVIGGSISWGQGASRRGETDWFSVFSKWVLQAFPRTNILLRNGCVPGTPAGYMTMCLELSSDNDTDIVFAEFTLNDGFESKSSITDSPVVLTYERLIRRVVGRGPHPPMIMIQVPTHGMAFPYQQQGWRPFHHTYEGLEVELAQYYDIPVLSFRNAAYRLANFRQEPGFLWRDIMSPDFIHPSDNGLKLIADMAVWLFQSTAIDLLIHQWDKDDMEQVMEPLPPPMNPGNEALQSSMCAHQDDLRRLVTEDATTGFVFKNEGSDEKPKKGYVATTAGAVLTLQVDTNHGGLGVNDLGRKDLILPPFAAETTWAPYTLKVDTYRDGGPGRVPVFLAHLKSYEHMGIAVVTCKSGCVCLDKTIDAHHMTRASQLYLAVIEASQHKQCIMTLTVQSETRSGEHKFKLGGVMLAEAANGQTRYEIPEGQWMMRYHSNSELQLRIDKNNIQNLSSSLTSVLA